MIYNYIYTYIYAYIYMFIKLYTYDRFLYISMEKWTKWTHTKTRSMIDLDFFRPQRTLSPLR